MDACPFELQIECSSSGKTETVQCAALLRAVPGTRHVYDAVWGGRPVIVKIFSHRLSAARHVAREWRGLNRLAELKLPAPAPLFHGRTGDGRLAVVVEKIARASTALDLLASAGDQAARLALLGRLCEAMARQHSCGVVQKDLHLGNLLLTPETVFMLDVAQMRFTGKPLGRRASIKQLSLLLCCLGDDEPESVSRLAALYAAKRQWQWSPRDDRRLAIRIRATRQRIIRRGLRKYLRTSSRTLRVESAGRRGVFDRRFATGQSPAQLVRKVEVLLEQGQVLKNGRTSFVSRVLWDGQEAVIKRYNHKGLWHSLRHTIKGSRARRNWLNAHHLALFAIATPEPLGYLDEYRGPLLWRSYFITRFVRGPRVQEVLRDQSVPEARKQQVTDKVLRLLDLMAKHGISHGDMKHTNVLYDGTNVVLTDLDAMRVGETGRRTRRRFQRDVDRYLRDLTDLRATSAPSRGPG